LLKFESGILLKNSYTAIKTTFNVGHCEPTLNVVLSLKLVEIGKKNPALPYLKYILEPRPDRRQIDCSVMPNFGYSEVLVRVNVIYVVDFMQGLQKIR
jgi:hypothetical protein